MKALDSPQATDIANNASLLAEEGFTAIGLYYFDSSGFKQQLTKDVAEKISSIPSTDSHPGLKIFSIYENGNPTSSSYFTTQRGNSDAHTAFARAQSAGQPLGSAIYFAIDYDASYQDLPKIKLYAYEFRRTLYALCDALGEKIHRYSVGVYGSGLVCEVLFDVGIAHYTFLAQSKGWAGYTPWQSKANIIQGNSSTLHLVNANPSITIDIDYNTIPDLNNAGLWSL